MGTDKEFEAKNMINIKAKTYFKKRPFIRLTGEANVKEF
jgi:hypothetical protein